MFKDFYKNAVAAFSGVPFDVLMWILCGSFAAFFVAAVIICLVVPSAKKASKKPFFCLLCAYTAAVFAAYLTISPVPDAAFAASVFWLLGYLLYGILCFLCRPKRAYAPAVSADVTAVSAKSLPPARAPRAKTDFPEAASRNNVRLEHALAVTDKLLSKNLGKTDRQELEKLKNTLEVLKIKGSLTPAEGEILNENFNTLLKLMAKYNI